MQNIRSNKLIIIFIAALVIIIGAVILKDQIIKTAVQIGASKVMGTDIKIGGLSFGVFQQSIRIKDFKVANPPGFPQGVMLDVPEIGVDYDLPALLKGKLHVPLIILNLHEMVVVRNREGKLNVDALTVAQKKEVVEPSPRKKEASQQLPLKIDVLRLNVGRVVYKDYGRGTEPSVQTFNVNLNNKTYRDIQSAQQLSALILVEAMKPTAIKGAKIYGVSTLLGVGFLPAGIAGALLGEDSARQEFDVAYDQAYRAVIEAIRDKGTIQSEKQDQGVAKAEVNGHSVSAKVTRLDQRKTEVVVTARKLLMPKPEMAQEILSEIQQRLK